jgi:hypothetical protein
MEYIPPRSSEEVDWESVRDMRVNGHTWAEITSAMSIPYERTLRAWRQEVHFVDPAVPRINNAVVQELRACGLPWNEVAEALGVNSEHLRYWRRSTNYEEAFLTDKDVSDEELDELVATCMSGHPERGYRMMMGHLLCEGTSSAHRRSVMVVLIAAQVNNVFAELLWLCFPVDVHVTRARVMETLRRLDPDASELRRRVVTVRRVYHSPCPHHVWHIDGHHKLIEYGLVIHGGVDGYSRFITMLNCADNNRADTVLRLFLRAASEYIFPEYIRTDHGLENIEAAQVQAAARGIDRVLVGTSTSNVRIERLWLDVKSRVVGLVHCCFSNFIARGVSFENHTHRFLMHFLFIPLINQELYQGVKAHNLKSHAELPKQMSPLRYLISKRHLIPMQATLSAENAQMLAAIRDDPSFEDERLYGPSHLKNEPPHWTAAQSQHFRNLARPFQYGDFGKNFDAFLWPRFLETVAAYNHVNMCN